jgi:tetratricopeptide (TPR) repeat protein
MILRRFCVAIFLVPVLAGGFANAVSAQSSAEWHELNRQIVQLRTAGKYGEAIPLAERALDLARRLRGLDHPEVAESLGVLAFLYVSQGRYSEAETLYKRSLAIKEKRLAQTTRTSVSSLTTLRSFIADRAVMPRPSRSTGAISQFWRKRTDPTMRRWGHRSTTSVCSMKHRAATRRPSYFSSDRLRSGIRDAILPL